MWSETNEAILCHSVDSNQISYQRNDASREIPRRMDTSISEYSTDQQRFHTFPDWNTDHGNAGRLAVRLLTRVRWQTSGNSTRSPRRPRGYVHRSPPINRRRRAAPRPNPVSPNIEARKARRTGLQHRLASDRTRTRRTIVDSAGNPWAIGLSDAQKARSCRKNLDYYH